MEVDEAFEKVLTEYAEVSRKIEERTRRNEEIDVNKFKVRRDIIDSEIANCEEAIRKAGVLYGTSDRKRYEGTANEYIARIAGLEEEKREATRIIQEQEKRNKEIAKYEMKRKLLRGRVSELRKELIADNSTKKPHNISVMKSELDSKREEYEKHKEILTTLINEETQGTRKAGNPEYKLYCKNIVDNYEQLENQYELLNGKWEHERINHINAIFMQTKMKMGEIDRNPMVPITPITPTTPAPTTPVPTTPAPTTPAPTTPAPTTPAPTTPAPTTPAPTTPAPTTPAPTTPAPTTPAPTTPAPTTPAPTTPAPTTPAPTTPAPTTPADLIRISIGRDFIMEFDQGATKRNIMIEEDELKENLKKMTPNKKLQMILNVVGPQGKARLEQDLGRELTNQELETNIDKFDDTIISSLQSIMDNADKSRNEDLMTMNAMQAYVMDVLNNEKTPGLAIQYDLEDLSKGKFRSFVNKVPFLKKRSPFLTRQQKDYIYDMAAKSAEFTEPAKGKYFKHSKLLRRFFKDDGKLALPAPKTQDSRESFMTKLQGYKMAEDPHKHMAQYEIDRLNRIDAERIAREAEAKKDSGRDR